MVKLVLVAVLLVLVLLLPSCATSEQRDQFLKAYHQQKLEDGRCK